MTNFWPSCAERPNKGIYHSFVANKQGGSILRADNCGADTGLKTIESNQIVIDKVRVPSKNSPVIWQDYKSTQVEKDRTRNGGMILFHAHLAGGRYDGWKDSEVTKSANILIS